MDQEQPQPIQCQQTLCQNAKISLPVTIKSYAKTCDIHVNCWSEPCQNEACDTCYPTVTLYISMRVPINTGATIQVGEPFLHG